MTCRTCHDSGRVVTLDERGDCVTCEGRKARAARVSAPPALRYAWGVVELDVSETPRRGRR